MFPQQRILATIEELLDSNVSLPAWISSAGIWTLPGDLDSFNYAIKISTSKVLVPGINGSAVCISIYLTSLAYVYAIAERNNSSSYSKCCGNLQVHHHSHPLLSSRLETLNPFITLYRSLMFLSLPYVASSLILSFRYSLFLFLKCLLASSYIVQINRICLALIL
jgi:hypothetical protein